MLTNFHYNTLLLFLQEQQHLELTGVAEGSDKMSVTSGRRGTPGSSDNVDYAQSR